MVKMGGEGAGAQAMGEGGGGSVRIRGGGVVGGRRLSSEEAGS